jgi:hypothetical protein
MTPHDLKIAAAVTLIVSGATAFGATAIARAKQRRQIMGPAK